MKEIFRDDNLLAVELPKQTRTFGFFRKYEDFVSRQRYELPEGVAVTSLTHLAVAFRTPEGLRVPNFHGVNLIGGVACLGRDLEPQSSLHEALRYHLDLYYERPFGGSPPKQESLYCDGIENYKFIHLNDMLFDVAFHSSIDARPYREHRYYSYSYERNSSYTPFSESEGRNTFVAYEQFSSKWIDRPEFDTNFHLAQRLEACR